MRIRLKVNVSGGLPAVLVIRDRYGRIVFYKRIYFSRNEICFCSCERYFAVTVIPILADYGRKSYFLRVNGRCYFETEIDFFFRLPEISEQYFLLFDRNYFFPVQKAVLSFRS